MKWKSFAFSVLAASLAGVAIATTWWFSRTPDPKAESVPTVTPATATIQPSETAFEPVEFTPTSTPWAWPTSIYPDVIPQPEPVASFPWDRITVSKGGMWTYLFLGTDDRSGTNDLVRTDTILLAFIVFDGEPHISWVSIPRDFFVFLPGRGMTRINNVWEYRGEEGLRDMLRYNFGLELNGYALLNMTAVPQFVDGVLEGRVDVETSGIFIDCGDFVIDHLSGIHPFSGKELECFVRDRSNGADYDRMQRQQETLLGIRNRIFQLAGSDLFGFIGRSFDFARSLGMNSSVDLHSVELLLNVPGLAQAEPLRYRLVPPFVTHFDHPETGAWLLAMPSAECRATLMDLAILGEPWPADCE